MTDKEVQKERKLTDRQEAFVAAYIGDANYNATKAAEIAGYAVARQSGSECLTNPVIQARIREHLDELKQTGLQDREVRIAALERLFFKAMALIDEEPTEIAYSNNGKEYRKFSKDVYSELRSLLEQIAKERGDHLTKLQVDATISNEPSQSAIDRLQAMIDSQDG